MLLRCDQNRVRNRLYTEPFLTIPGWFESPESQRSNHPGIIKSGSVYSRLRTRFWFLEGNVRGIVLRFFFRYWQPLYTGHFFMYWQFTASTYQFFPASR